jgi:nucleotide-binding universal stress UspA family protein
MSGLIVIGYDGSVDARRAVAAARAMDAERALVVNVCEPPLAAGTSPLPMGAGQVLPTPDDEARREAAARETSEEGAELARQAGFAAEPVVVRGASAGEIGKLLAALAQERDATAIVVGRRGISRLEAVVLGSVSDATVRQAHCPVLVVPAPDEDE